MGANDEGTPVALAIRLFGPPDVRVDGALLPRRKTRKGLWLLALRQDRAIERDWLVGTLWPDNDESRSLLAFDHAAAERNTASLERAAAYGGLPLEDCAEEWIVAEREERRQAFLGVLEALAEQALAEGDAGRLSGP